MRISTLATCTLNQWAMDFDGNHQRILESILIAKQKGATYRCGPELEVTGYGCADHFYESDTIFHSWEVIAQIMKNESCKDIIIDVGMPVMHKNVTYNCRVLILNKKILLIRPKKKLCDNGIYRESRWFTAWSKYYCTESFILPDVIRSISGQITVPIGDAIICTSDTCIGYEICEELWNPESSLIEHCNNGVEITINSSGGFHEIGGTSGVINVIKSATKKCGGVYVFSNLRGCDGDLVYYHGTSHITLNGNIAAIGEQFSLKDVEVVTATLDLDDVVTYRRSICQSTSHQLYPQIDVDYCITASHAPVTPLYQDSLFHPKVYADGEEIALGPACWLWDYLRRSNFNGILLPLEGDINSCSSAVIVYSMCNLVCSSITDGNLAVLSDLRKILHDSTYVPSDPKALCSKILTTCHFDFDKEKCPAVISVKDLVKDIGSNHFNLPFENVILAISSALILVFSGIFRKKINHDIKLAVQSNIERIKLIILYVLAEMLSPSVRGSSHQVLVLGTGDSDNILLGNFVKYGCFSNDISLTGSINQENLRWFLKFSRHYFKLASLDKIFLPITEDKLNAEIVGISKEINILCKLKKNGCGPYSSFCKLVSKCKKEELVQVSEQVKSFFSLYALHYPKRFSTASCLHLGLYDTANSYYDQRQILYNTKWTWQFSAIDNKLNLMLSPSLKYNDVDPDNASSILGNDSLQKTIQK